jgi:hypothetical protein
VIREARFEKSDSGISGIEEFQIAKFPNPSIPKFSCSDGTITRSLSLSPSPTPPLPRVGERGIAGVHEKEKEKEGRA